MMLNYSVVIRTLGNTGDKYLQMLHAINNQTVKPREIVVVIPHGYELDHSLGNERVVYSEKGMVTQRAVGIEEAQGEYLLVLDDDLDFPPDFAERLYAHLLANKLDCVLAFPTWKRSTVNVTSGHQGKKSVNDFLKRLRGAFTGQVFYSSRQSDFFDVITATAGHRTYINYPEKLCQAGCFQCFFINANKAKAIGFNDERWLEQGTLSQYAAYDDAVFFYKFYLQGGRIAYSQDSGYDHLDAGAGRPAKDKLTSKRIRLYSIARNRAIFWHRHIWSNHKSVRTLFG